ncbi:MAG: hypothetical protein D8H97_45640, partial [Neisseria sp.]
MGKGQKTGFDARLQAFATWNAQFGEALAKIGDEALARFDDIFTFAYREEHTPAQAVDDAKALANLGTNNPLAIQLWHDDVQADELRLCLYGKDDEIVRFQKVAHILENLGLPVLTLRDYRLADGYWLQSYGIDLANSRFQPGDSPEPYLANIIEAFISVWTGASEDDDLNHYVSSHGCDIREIAMLRALGKYMIQAGAPYSYEQIRAALNANPDAAAALIAAFHA